ncbi:hypothetical protein AAFF_G00328120 [Aldrovandia affinis]|uniref:Uncharacterized protein n=1 Tax=Aldrovandia affinis TaxID=143900 RepID=A0AAD7T9L7_9TELE|nr:hypothetical protein AAFF_G00328120 [Aldrovandia affinis]
MATTEDLHWSLGLPSARLVAIRAPMSHAPNSPSDAVTSVSLVPPMSAGAATPSPLAPARSPQFPFLFIATLPGIPIRAGRLLPAASQSAALPFSAQGYLFPAPTAAQLSHSIFLADALVGSALACQHPYPCPAPGLPHLVTSPPPHMVVAATCLQLGPLSLAFL